MPTEIPEFIPPPSFQQINEQRQAELERVTAISGGSRRRKKRRMYGGISEVARTGNAESDMNAAKAAALINHMDVITAKQKIGGGRKKRRLRTRKYIKVNYVRKRR